MNDTPTPEESARDQASRILVQYPVPTGKMFPQMRDDIAKELLREREAGRREGREAGRREGADMALSVVESSIRTLLKLWGSDSDHASGLTAALHDVRATDVDAVLAADEDGGGTAVRCAQCGEEYAAYSLAEERVCSNCGKDPYKEPLKDGDGA